MIGYLLEYEKEELLEKPDHWATAYGKLNQKNGKSSFFSARNGPLDQDQIQKPSVC